MPTPQNVFSSSNDATISNCESGIQSATADEVGEKVTNEENPVPLDDYPTNEEISAYIEAGDTKLYWLVSPPIYSGYIDVHTVEALSMEEFWHGLEKSFFSEAHAIDDVNNLEFHQITYSLDGAEYVIKIDDTSITIVPTMYDSALEKSLIDALEQLTGTQYVETAPIEDADVIDTRYVQALNEYHIDDTGYSLEADVWNPGSCMDIWKDGTIFISYPLIVEETIQSVEVTDLVSVDTVEEILQAYYKTYDTPSVAVVCDIALEYYYMNQELRPAWRCTRTMYMSSENHQDTQLVDAQTGEIIRK